MIRQADKKISNHRSIQDPCILYIHTQIHTNRKGSHTKDASFLLCGCLLRFNLPAKAGSTQGRPWSFVAPTIIQGHLPEFGTMIRIIPDLRLVFTCDFIGHRSIAFTFRIEIHFYYYLYIFLYQKYMAFKETFTTSQNGVCLNYIYYLKHPQH